MTYNIFISWADPVSKSLAAALHEWLPTVIQAAEPFMSDKDIDAGARGLQEISSQLMSIKIGLICLTGENQSFPWLNFEAGALPKLIEDTYVVPLALDMDKGQIKNPLGQFQAQRFTEDDIRHTTETINKALGHPLTEVRLETSFRRAWPDLATKIEKIRSERSQEAFFEEEPRRTTEEMLEEVVVTLREQTGILRKLQEHPSHMPVVAAQFSATASAIKRLSGFYAGGENLMSLKEIVEVAPQFDEQDWRVVESAPFLLWYLTQYQGISRRTKIEEPKQGQDFDDVPF